jgi:hypothetical protein
VLLTLVDSLRCPAHDEASSLVLSVEKWAGPRVSEGVLGCPRCRARYRIHRGAVDFVPGEENVRRGRADVDPARLAAQLSLTEPGGIILLTGGYATVHAELTEFVDTTFVLVDAAETDSPTAVNFQVADRLPLGNRALRGAAIDEARGTSSFVGEVVRCLRVGGRIVAPRAAPLPPGVRQIAVDEKEWVGEAGEQGATIQLRRAGPSLNT